MGWIKWLRDNTDRIKNAAEKIESLTVSGPGANGSIVTETSAHISVVFPKPERQIKFCQVDTIYDSDSLEWVSYLESGFQHHCTAHPCNADGTQLDTNTLLYIKLTADAEEADIGIQCVVDNDIIGYLVSESNEAVDKEPASDINNYFDGTCVLHAGLNGVYLSPSQDPALYDIYAKVSSGDTTTGYLNDKLRGDNVWIETEVISPSGDEKLQFNHIGPSGYDPAKSIYVLETLSSDTSWYINGKVNEIRFDPRGHFVESFHSDGYDISVEISGSLAGLYDVSAASPSDGDLLQYNSTSSKWENVSTTIQTVVTAMQVSGVYVQVKTRDIKVIVAGDESAWTTIHTGTDCSGV